MASFGNHKSSVSALRAKLGAFARELDETMLLSSASASVTEDASSSHEFLEEQEQRLWAVEHNLLRATDYILPREEERTTTTTSTPSRPDPNGQMTITELTQIIESLQDLQASQISRLEEMVGLKEIEIEQDISQQQPTPSQYSTFAGTPLDAVMETDHETDASRTTPGSLAFFSPDYGFSNGKKAGFSSTPETPTFQDLRLSASTVSILEQEMRGSVGSFLQASSVPFVETTTTTATATTAHMNHRSSYQADDEASSIDETSSGEDDDDDETFDGGRTIATVRTVVAEGRESRFQRQSIQTHTQNQQDDNDDETFDEGRTIATVRTVVAEGRQSRFQRQSIQTHTQNQQDDDDDDGETCDDSAIYCPTVVARDRIQPLEDFARDNHDHANSPSENPNITHIEVDYGFSSPTPTNLTMDTAAFLNETIGQLDTVFEKEDDMSVASDETPILDRYRIDIDENSPNGFRVVPNERGTRHPRNTHSDVTPATGSAKKASPGVAASPMPKTPLSKRHSKPVFRKTPYPKKKFPTTPTIDENTPFNGSVSPSLRPVRSTESPLASHRPLRALASPKLERTRLSYPISQQEERPTGPSSTLPPSLPNAKAALEMENPDSSRRFLTSTSTFPSLPDRSNLNAVVGHHIRPVTLSEYDDGPRVVKMQVSFKVLNDATAALNDTLCQRHGARAKQLEHSEANQILQPLGISERKSRSILMTLCHFRRLMMKRHSISGDKNHDIVFDVVTA